MAELSLHKKNKNYLPIYIYFATSYKGQLGQLGVGLNNSWLAWLAWSCCKLSKKKKILHIIYIGQPGIGQWSNREMAQLYLPKKKEKGGGMPKGKN